MDEMLQRFTDSPVKAGAFAVSFTALTYVTVKTMFGVQRSEKRHPYPPGPPPDPVIGNVRQFPKDHYWDRFCQWAKKYGACFFVGFPLGGAFWVCSTGTS